MPEEPQIKNLSYKRRQQFFYVLVLIFLLALPALIFYTTGYRLDFDSEEQTIVTTGGLYITTENLEVDVYLDEVLMDSPRLFRNAYYIQNITAGQHRVVVQNPGYSTWVKVLAVDPYLVVEAAAFNFPTVPQIRPITRYITATGTPVYRDEREQVEIFSWATSTVPVFFDNSPRLNVSYQLNNERTYVAGLFGTSTVSNQSVFERIIEEVGKFGFATTTEDDNGTSTASTTEDRIRDGDLELIEHDGELYAHWLGYDNGIPYYFCVSDVASSTMADRYGFHVAESVEQQRLSTTTPLLTVGSRLCRTEIRIDRKWQDVYFYDFFPGDRDLVIMQLQDGLYVTEIDDRSWQNTQLLYPGDDFQVRIENGVIYIKDGEYYFELLTEIVKE